MRQVGSKKSVKKTDARVDSVARKLSRWFASHARALPWRENPEPYAVWLSEVMLQQTQVTAVLPYFNKFTEKFPRVEELASASLDEVYALWAGLGYYSRARNLHRGAQAIHGRLRTGRGFPSSREEWLEIPGVGEYTAGAVCSIALNQREAIVDGNVVRVLSRIFAVDEVDAAKSQVWELARRIVEVKSVEPRVVNQALMELGALICKPKNPRCEECPVREECRGKTRWDLYPAPKPKKKWKHVTEEKWVLVFSGQVFLTRDCGGNWRKGLWDFPMPNSLPVSRVKLLKEETTRYVVTNHRVERKHFVFELNARQAEKLATFGMWFGDKELPGVPAPVKKFLAKLR